MVSSCFHIFCLKAYAYCHTHNELKLGVRYIASTIYQLKQQRFVFMFRYKIWRSQQERKNYYRVLIS